MKWLKRGEVADKLGVSYNYLRLTLEKLTGFPKPITLSPKVIVFEEGAVDAWMKSRAEDVNEETEGVLV